MHSSKTPPTSWLWTSGVALIVFAVRCREVRLYAGDVPYLDQWWVEAHQIIVPWLQGKLSWTAFFQPHHEHIPLWTRLLAWVEAALLGRWDPPLQCTINAAFFGLAAGMGTDWLRRVLPLLPAMALTALIVALAILPHGWENSTWGFQSSVPIALLLVVSHVRGSFEQKANSPKWWLAQAAGLGALFTFGSMWAAPAAVVIVIFWTGTANRWRWISPAFIAVVGITLLLVARSLQPHSGAFVQSAGSIQQFLAAFLLQLGWPSQWSGVAILMFLPTLLLAMKLRRNGNVQPLDMIALTLALHSVIQAAAFAYGRAGGYIGFVSRYGDLLSLGVIANALALWRLWQGRFLWRPLATLLAIGWLVAFTLGIKWVSTRAHTEYFHEHAAPWASLRRDAVKQYLTGHDSALLSSQEVRAIFYPDPAIVISVLDTPGVRELLPVSVRPNGPRTRGDFISAAFLYIRNVWPILLWTGAILFSLAVGLTLANRSTVVPASLPLPDCRRVPLMAGLTVIVGFSIFLWPMPFEFRGQKRWSHMLAPPDTIKNLTFAFLTPTSYQADRLTGAASLWPEDFRNTFYGTHIDGPAFKGTAQSSLFLLNSPWVVIPYAGFPSSERNSLRLQIEDKAGHVLAELKCPGPNPTDIDFWSVDVSSYAGQQGRLVFYDGRDDAEGWLAAVPPQPAKNGELAKRLHQSWALERTTLGHDSLGVIFLSLLGLTLLFVFTEARQRSKIRYRSENA